MEPELDDCTTARWLEDDRGLDRDREFGLDRDLCDRRGVLLWCTGETRGGDLDWTEDRDCSLPEDVAGM